MKSFKTIIALTVLLVASIVNAEILTQPETLADGSTVIPAGAEMVIGEDGTVQYTQDGIILASVKTVVTDGQTSYHITKRLKSGSYVLVIVGENGSKSTPTPTPAPTAVTPAPDGGAVAGDVGTQGPSGASIPNNPATVI